MVRIYAFTSVITQRPEGRNTARSQRRWCRCSSGLVFSRHFVTAQSRSKSYRKS